MKLTTRTLFKQNRTIAGKFTPSKSIVVYPGTVLTCSSPSPMNRSTLVLAAVQHREEYEGLHLDVPGQRTRSSRVCALLQRHLLAGRQLR